jgi:predicted phage tail protein
MKHSREMYPHHIELPLQGDFHLIPVAAGGKSRSTKIIFSIVVGGVLLATGIGGALGAFGAVTGGLMGGFAATTGFLGITYGTVALMGAGLLLGGLSMLLTPAPKITSEDQKATSFTFDAPANAIDEGSPVPLVYGLVIAGTATIASDIRSNAIGGGSVPGIGAPGSGTGTGGGTQSSSGGVGSTVSAGGATGSNPAGGLNEHAYTTYN